MNNRAARGAGLAASPFLVIGISRPGEDGYPVATLRAGRHPCDRG